MDITEEAFYDLVQVFGKLADAHTRIADALEEIDRTLVLHFEIGK